MDMNLEICLYPFNQADLMKGIITPFNLSEAQ